MIAIQIHPWTTNFHQNCLSSFEKFSTIALLDKISMKNSQSKVFKHAFGSFSGLSLLKEQGWVVKLFSTNYL